MTRITEDKQFGLLVQFPDQSPAFVNGFEAGMLWADMQRGDTAEIERTVHEDNRECIERMAAATGWEVDEIARSPEWLHLRLLKTRKTPERPNPAGLRLVRT